MKLFSHNAGRRGFTMVEIALCLGIIAFAMVAIVGVLPTGLTVQRENREDTIINRDGAYFLEAIRSGSEGLDDLTNFVESITISSRKFPFRVEDGTAPENYTNGVPQGNARRFISGYHIIGLLSRPKYHFAPDGALWMSTVTAQVKGLNGRALDRSETIEDMAFRYNMVCEVTPFTNVPPALNLVENVPVNLLQITNMSHNLYDVRLTMRWPVFERNGANTFGRRRATFRTLAAGEMIVTNSPALAGDFYFIQPSLYTSR